MAELSSKPTAKLVFITGASSGIGQALALAYFQAGYQLALVARRVLEVESWASQHNISQDSYKIYSANVADIDGIVAAGKACIVSQGLPDVVIANAGISVGVDTAIREDLDQLAQTTLAWRLLFTRFLKACCYAKVANWSVLEASQVFVACLDMVLIVQAKRQ
jgi:NADP-dependent 3-hydroxy acid dehydrogenase YdfG